jgi:uncharacterized membrane protein
MHGFAQKEEHMDITWTGTVTIAAPIERVYAYLADFPRHAEWAQSVQQLSVVEQGRADGSGRVYRTAERQDWQSDRKPYEALSRGVPGDTMCKVLELIPNRRIAWHSWAPVPGVRHEGDFAFELEAVPGGTKLIQTVRLSDNWLGDLVSRFVFKTTPEKAYAQWQASLRNIQHILEEHAAASIPQSTMHQGGTYVA